MKCIQEWPASKKKTKIFIRLVSFSYRIQWTLSAGRWRRYGVVNDLNFLKVTQYDYESYYATHTRLIFIEHNGGQSCVGKKSQLLRRSMGELFKPNKSSPIDNRKSNESNKKRYSVRTVLERDAHLSLF